MQGAIAFWQTALSAYQSTNNLANQAIVREKLAIAYQQIGQFEQAGEFVKVGHLLTELAPPYSRLGQN